VIIKDSARTDNMVGHWTFSGAGLIIGTVNNSPPRSLRWTSYSANKR